MFKREYIGHTTSQHGALNNERGGGVSEGVDMNKQINSTNILGS